MIAENSVMIEFDEALEIVLNNANSLSTEFIAIEHLLGRILVKPVLSTCELPLFDNSAVDGFVLSSADIKNGIRERSFKLIGEIRAGSCASTNLSEGLAARVFTGAPLPIGTGGVAMQEIAKWDGSTVQFYDEIVVGDHVRKKGTEHNIGSEVVGTGIVSPATIGALAACGIREAEVFRQPKIGLLISGDELARAGASLSPGQIYESNGASLTAAIVAMGLEKPDSIHCCDDLDTTLKALTELTERNDVVITTGGVSIGDHDVLRPAFDLLGVRQLFHKVAIKPGKPLYFGQRGSCAVFGLPGNPVSALTTYFLFAKPFLCKMSGMQSSCPRVSMTLMADLKKKPGRAEFVPCRIDSNCAYPMVERASHKSSCLASANGLIILESESEAVGAGSIVKVIELKWGLEA